MAKTEFMIIGSCQRLLVKSNNKKPNESTAFLLISGYEVCKKVSSAKGALAMHTGSFPYVFQNLCSFNLALIYCRLR